MQDYTARNSESNNLPQKKQRRSLIYKLLDYRNFDVAWGINTHTRHKFSRIITGSFLGIALAAYFMTIRNFLLIEPNILLLFYLSIYTYIAFKTFNFRVADIYMAFIFIATLSLFELYYITCLYYPSLQKMGFYTNLFIGIIFVLLGVIVTLLPISHIQKKSIYNSSEKIKNEHKKENIDNPEPLALQKRDARLIDQLAFFNLIFFAITFIVLFLILCASILLLSNMIYSNWTLNIFVWFAIIFYIFILIKNGSIISANLNTIALIFFTGLIKFLCDFFSTQPPKMNNISNMDILTHMIFAAITVLIFSHLLTHGSSNKRSRS